MVAATIRVGPAEMAVRLLVLPIEIALGFLGVGVGRYAL
jgi:hypothetical protein